MNQKKITTDICIVGSGPGGSVTAATLSEAGRAVLILEEGPDLAVESAGRFSLEEMQTKYRNRGLTLCFGKPGITYVEGRCVGGGSEINSGLYLRTPDEVLAEWSSRFGVKRLTTTDLIPHFLACERELEISPNSAPNASSRLLVGAQRLGWECLEASRWEKDGRRNTMSRTFLPRALSSGTKLLAGAQVIGVKRRGGGGWLIEFLRENVRSRVSADHLFLSAGAIQTAALLRRSLGHRLAGNRLQVHPTLRVSALFDEEVNYSGMGVGGHQIKEFSPGISLGASVSGPPQLALALQGYPEERKSLPKDWRRRAVFYAMIRPLGSGTVRKIPGFRDPWVRYRLLGSDRESLANAEKWLSQVLFASGATRVFPDLENGAPLLMSVHLFSSCPMGEDRNLCVTDSYGRVHGERNLHIADASILPSAPGVNPQGTIMALARRNAFHFLEATSPASAHL